MHPLVSKCVALSCIALTAIACNSSTSDKPQPSTTAKVEPSRHLRAYARAMEMGDFHSAIFALNQHLMDDSTETRWYDTLAILYLNTNNFLPASWSAERVLQNDPRNLRMLELKAVAEQNLGRKDRILEAYGKLYEATSDYQYLYQSAAIEFTAGNLKRSRELVDTLMQRTIADTDSIEIQIDNEYSQQVPLKAALFNLQAFLKARSGDYPGARKDFETALKIYPNFVLAKRNLQDMLGGGKQNGNRR